MEEQFFVSALLNIMAQVCALPVRRVTHTYGFRNEINEKLVVNKADKYSQSHEKN